MVRRPACRRRSCTPGIVVVRRLPRRRRRPTCCPSRRAVPQGHAGDLAPHGTTIVAATFPGGVVMAGDRRATMGNIIAQRDIEKVFPADEYSCVGIAGTAGLAVEMVRLFQTELEHYEKIEGTTLSLDGKANRLAALIRGNLGMAMQGLAVVPLFAGYDLDAGQGRIFSYDVTGGRYEETAFHSVGSGSLFARGSLKKLYRDDLDRRADASPAVVQALYDAADDDSATGGPDLTRRIFPVVQVITADGGRRLPDAEVAAIADRVIAGRMNRPDGPAAAARPEEDADMSMPFYVSPEQLMKDRADFARKGIARGRSVVVGPVRRRHPVRLREPLPGAAQGPRDLRPDRLRRGRPLQRVREPADRRRPARRHARLLLRPARRHRPRAGQRLRPDARHDLLQRRREALRGGDLRRRDRRRRRRRPDLPADLRRPGRRRARVRRDGRRGRRRSRRTSRSTTPRAPRSPRRSRSPSPRWATPTTASATG